MLSFAVLLDMLLPDPQISWHPIALIGRWIAFLEKNVRKILGNTYISGFLLVILTIGGSLSVTALLIRLSKSWSPANLVLTTVLLYFLLCGATLRRSGTRVLEALQRQDLPVARERLQEIVGRDTSQLQEPEIIKAVLETLSENSIDGLVSPLLFMFVGSFLGHTVLAGLLYKCINTLDSMVGYKDEKYRFIGFASAKLDDIANYLPARIGGVLINLCGGFSGLDMVSGFRMMFRDAHNHLSPNAGWAEASVAGLLGVRLGGDAIYFGKTVKKASLGDEKRQVAREDILRINRLIVMLEGFFLLVSILLCGGK